MWITSNSINQIKHKQKNGQKKQNFDKKINKKCKIMTKKLVFEILNPKNWKNEFLNPKP